jgi:putative tricarboxylic transport membrane protein
MKLSDRLTGLGLVALGVAAWWVGSSLPPVPGQQVGPSAFPMVVGGGLALCGLLIALGAGSRIEEEAEAEVARHAEAVKAETGEAAEAGGTAGAPGAAGVADAASPPARPWLDTLRTFTPPALLLFYVLAVERLGFVPTAFVVVFVSALALGGRPRHAAPVAAVAAVLVHLVFYKLLRVPLPAGLLPMPW